MIIEVKCAYETKAKHETITVTDTKSGQSFDMPGINDSWRSTFFVETADNTPAPELVRKVRQYIIDTLKAVPGSVKVKSLTKLQLVKL